MRKFIGDVFYYLENSKTIYRYVNGDFYNSGVTKINYKGNMNLEIGAGVTTEISLPNQGDHYRYSYVRACPKSKKYDIML